jgi:hypothetical protein
MENVNPKQFEDSKYTVELVLPANPGEEVETSIVTRERPFALQLITHQVIGDDAGTDTEQYSIDWSIQNEKRYFKGQGAPMARAGFGSIATGRWINFRQPIAIEAKTTLFVKLQNRYTVSTETRKVQVIFHGSERVF